MAYAGWLPHSVLFAIAGLLFVGAVARAGDAEQPRLPVHVRTLIERYCVRCHGPQRPRGELNLVALVRRDRVAQDFGLWQRVLQQVAAEEMPPEEPLPSAAERQQLTGALTRLFERIDWKRLAKPGHVTLPRLTNREYVNTLQDLLGVPLPFLAERFPPEGPGESGFDTDRDGLFVTPTLMDKYFEAAERALEVAVALEHEPIRVHLESEDMFMTETRETPKRLADLFGYVLNRGQMSLYESVSFPFAGIYEFRLRAASTGNPTAAMLQIDAEYKTSVLIPTTEPREYVVRVPVEAGMHAVQWNIDPDFARRAWLEQAARNARPPSTAKDIPARRGPSAVDAAPRKQNTRSAKYRPLPKNAAQLVTERAMANAPRYRLTEGNPPAATAAVRRVDQAAYSLQRPFEWLRLLGTDGDPAEIVRFKGYVRDRQKTLDQQLDGLAKALNVSPEEVRRRFAEQNAERLAENRALLERVKNVTSARRRPKKPDMKAGGKPPKPGFVAIDWMEVVGPLRPENAPEQAAIFTHQPLKELDPSRAADPRLRAVAAANLRDWLPRAFRRPVSDGDVERYMKLYDRAAADGADYHHALKLAAVGTLVSPRFLFRSELRSVPAGGEPYRLDDFQIAARLSYFLWQTMPDQRLFALARQGRLSQPEVLRAEVRRMLADERVRHFLDTFLAQWLGYEELGRNVTLDRQRFPQFTPALVRSMKREPVEAFRAILVSEGSLYELIDTDTVWVDQRLAQLYGLDGVSGAGFRAVRLSDRRRGGVLGMAAVLAATSAPSRTSPVVRGAWVLQTLLGQKLPQPPPDAGTLPPDAGTRPGVTVREELQRHRREARCAVCHDKIDPIGFGLENFDAIGRWRTTENGKPIDASGRLPDGATFDGPAELKEYLLDSGREAFVRTLTERLLAYALGRKLQFYDRPVVEEITRRVMEDGGRARRLIEEIVLSRPFLWQDPEPAEAAHAEAAGPSS